MAKFAKIIQENNENFLIEKFIRLFCLSFFDKLKIDGHEPTSLHSISKFFTTTFFDF